MIFLDIYKNAEALVSEKPQKDIIKNLAIPWINIILAECLYCENSIRQSKNMPILNSAPIIKSFNENIDYDENLCRTALIYALTSYLYLNDEDDYKYNVFRNLYINSLEENCKVHPLYFDGGDDFA